MTISARYLAKLFQLNSARLVPDHFVMSPEAFHELQSEGYTPLGDSLYYEMLDSNSGMRQSLFGIKIVVDPDLRGDEVFLEIAV